MTRILYVEDNDDNVYMLKLRFELLEDFEILIAENGETGCAVAIAEQPDIIIMDLDLPVLDGWEATCRLTSNPATKTIPIIALTAHAMSGSREKALAVGCDEFDTKPVAAERREEYVPAVSSWRSPLLSRDWHQNSGMTSSQRIDRVCRAQCSPNLDLVNDAARSRR